MPNIDNICWPGWETVRLIGRGSFGSVYEIQRNVFGDVEKAALKVISIPQNDSDISALYDDGYDEESITNTFKSRIECTATSDKHTYGIVDASVFSG